MRIVHRGALGATLVRSAGPARVFSRSLILSELRVDPPPPRRHQRNLPRQTLLLSNKAASVVEAAAQGADSWSPYHYALFFGGLHKAEGVNEAVSANQELVLQVS